MRGFLFRLTSLLPVLFALIAMGLISYGVWLYSHPAGFIVAGVLLLLAIVDSRT